MDFKGQQRDSAIFGIGLLAAGLAVLLLATLVIVGLFLRS